MTDVKVTRLILLVAGAIIICAGTGLTSYLVVSAMNG